MTVSAFIPVAYAAAANEELEQAGFGPGNFSVPVRSGYDAATHAAFHSWDDTDFLAAVQALDYPGLVIRHDAGTAVNFSAHVAAENLEWSDPALWFENPVMKGDERTHGGKLWVSLIDYNVWQPPVGWREVVTEGYPAWVEPTGAHDAYPMGARVKHKGSNWQNTGSAANVWEPGVFGWAVI